MVLVDVLVEVSASVQKVLLLARAVGDGGLVGGALGCREDCEAAHDGLGVGGSRSVGVGVDVGVGLRGRGGVRGGGVGY